MADRNFEQVQVELQSLKHMREVYLHLLEYLDQDFRSTGEGTKPKKFMLLEDRTSVPESALELVAGELSAKIEGLQSEIADILSTPLAVASQEPSQEAAPETSDQVEQQPVVPVQPASGRGRRRKADVG